MGEELQEVRRPVLKQLFVTVSPKLCYAVRKHVFHLKSFAQGGKFSAEVNSFDMDYVDDAAQFKDIPDCFLDIPSTSYPLVITFRKFLMMLDGTHGTSYFERFHDARNLFQGKSAVMKSLTLHNFMTTREVDYNKFSSSYWPHFNSQLKKRLDSSRVFTEIMSHIKGGLRAGESYDGILSRENYVSLSEGRVSTLSKDKREIIYHIFQDYEKMKMGNGEFDLADFVIDLHRRFSYEKYEGVDIHFVYIDEVQDLTMRQISLFKYVCRNVKEGFVFSGDTAQTIARGIDFRFQDIRSLFYTEFVLEAKDEGTDRKKGKGQLSEVFHLSQNFRTHAGVLKLAQSTIDLLYRYFPESIDVLCPETSLIYGEAPILLNSGYDEDAIITIFGNSGNACGSITGFGAEQVILVRDDSAREKISGCVGKRALVLTIVECKGLEFQDVLLYNFFGSSPLRNQWRVVYEFMKEQDLLDNTSSRSFPSFNRAKHNILCSELKHLYVAITRTRQRLWICENVEELSKPIFDYWKKLNLVQVRQLDASLAQAMQVTSSPEEWRSQGLKLLGEKNFEMATMCFEKAGDEYWEKYAKAAGHKASADRMHNSSPQDARDARRQAAEIFEYIGKADSAAECFYMLEEFEKAGRLYLEKCGESKKAIAAECFSRAGCYEHAVEVYAKGNYFSECLSACSKGNLFEIGLQYIQYWKQNKARYDVMSETSMQLDQIEQKFLESCALHYYELKDNITMLKYVKAFPSIGSVRIFLNALDCLEELLLVEEEAGNFLEAANIAKMRGDLLLEADLLGKAGKFKEASLHILWYVLAYSLWAPGSSGWPLKQFTGKEELLHKAKDFAKKESDLFYEAVCTETDILSSKLSGLVEMKKCLNSSQKHQNISGQVLLVRKILDVHFALNTSKYDWEDELVVDVSSYSEEKISCDHVSIETLVHFWNLWKEKIANIFEYLGCIERREGNEYWSYGEFCLNYMGVWRQFVDLDTNFVLFRSDVNWARDIDNRSLRKSGRIIYIDVRQFVSVVRIHWSSEFLSVGMKVLEALEALYNLSTKKFVTTFSQTKSLVHIYDIAKYILDSKFLDHRYQDSKTLRRLIQLSADHFFVKVFPLDWRKSLVENMVSLRGTEPFSNLIEGIISDETNSKSRLSYGQIGRLVVMFLGFGKLNNKLYIKIIKRFEGNIPWKMFMENLGTDMIPNFPMFHRALEDTYSANWRNLIDYISPACFIYLIERCLLLVCSCRDYFFTTKAAVVEWFVYKEWDANPCPKFMRNEAESVVPTIGKMAHMVHQLIQNKHDTMDWIRKAGGNVKDYYPLLLLRLFVILCLVCMNHGQYYYLLFGLMGRNDITAKLPWEFYDFLRKRLKPNDPSRNEKIFAEAFVKIENPLVIVTSGKNRPIFLSPESILVDLMANQSRVDLFRVFFRIKDPPSQGQIGDVEQRVVNVCGESSMKLPSSEISMANQDVNLFQCPDGDAIDALNSDNSGTQDRRINNMSDDPTFKMETLNEDHSNDDLQGEATSMLDEMNELVAAKEGSENNTSRIQELTESLEPRIPCMMHKMKVMDSYTKIYETSYVNGDNKDMAEEEECVLDEDKMRAGSSESKKNKGSGNNNKKKKNKKGKNGRKK